MTTDAELSVCGNEVLRQHGERAPAFIAERIGAIVLEKNFDAMWVWKEIARRAADLMMPTGRENQHLR